MSNYTPGPWSIHSIDGSAYAVIGPDRPDLHPSSPIICEILEGPREANARLIAAAPDMKALLERAARSMRGDLHGPLGDEIEAFLRELGR